jgi:L-lactate dehydrogenase complex protein LldG
LPRFESELRALKGELGRASSWDEADAWLARMAREHRLERVVAADTPDAVHAGRVLGARILTGDGDCGHDLAHVDLGITCCDCLVANTGSVVLTARSGFGRSLSVLPPAHMVVAHTSQLVAHLSDAYRLLRERYGRSRRGWPSMMTVITGPSRTADIEKILVLGAHGPKKLFVLLLDF